MILHNLVINFKIIINKAVTFLENFKHWKIRLNTTNIPIKSSTEEKGSSLVLKVIRNMRLTLSRVQEMLGRAGLGSAASTVTTHQVTCV